MNIKSFKDLTGCEYTLLVCGDSLNLSVNGQILSINQEQFREISEMADKEWGCDKVVSCRALRKERNRAFIRLLG